jgi:hypothetical protein
MTTTQEALGTAADSAQRPTHSAEPAFWSKLHSLLNSATVVNRRTVVAIFASSHRANPRGPSEVKWQREDQADLYRGREAARAEQRTA